MDSKNYTQVLIDGRIYTLGGSEDEAYLQKAASYVNEKSAQMRGIPGFSKQNADYQMIMTELNIADDYFKALEWAEGMERQKNDMEKETYSLKHELVSTQMKLEAVLKDLEDRQRELDRLTRANAQMEGELSQARQELEAYMNIQPDKEAEEGCGRTANGRAEEGAPKAPASGEETAVEMETAPEVGNVAEAAVTEVISAREKAAGENAAVTGASEAAASLQPSGISDEELARKALQAAKKASSHRGGRR